MNTKAKTKLSNISYFEELGYYKTLQAAMNAEKSEYLEAHIFIFGNAPLQFNVHFGIDGKDTYYKVEFMKEEHDWINATTCFTGAEATKIFIECDASKIDLSNFENDWIALEAAEASTPPPPFLVPLNH